MPKFEVRLESPTSAQSRIVSVHDAADADAARQIAEQAELHLVRFSLLPPEKDVWEIGGHAQVGLADGDAVVDHSRWDARHAAFSRTLQGLPYEQHVKAAQQRLEVLADRIQIDKSGKVVQHALSPVAKARYLAHLQAEPYEAAEVREVSTAEVDAQRLVALARKLLAEKDPRYDPAGWQRIIDTLCAMGFPVAAVTAQVHGIAVKTTDDGSAPIVWGTDAIFNALLTGYTANVDTHQHWSDISAFEVTGTAYVANGQQITSPTSTYDTASDQTRLDGADSSWTSSTISATDSAIVDRTPATDATRPVYGSADFGGTVSTTNGTFSEVWDATGIIVRDYT